MVFTDIKEVFNNMPESFNPSAAQGLDVVIQYDISGDRGGNWHIKIKDGACEIQEGSHESPNVTLTMSAETWLAIVNKETNGMQAFMSGRLQVTGDMMIAQRIEQMFPS
jgi:putative sterol carrier protein